MGERRGRGGNTRYVRVVGEGIVYRREKGKGGKERGDEKGKGGKERGTEKRNRERRKRNWEKQKRKREMKKVRERGG